MRYIYRAYEPSFFTRQIASLAKKNGIFDPICKIDEIRSLTLLKYMFALRMAPYNRINVGTFSKGNEVARIIIDFVLKCTGIRHD